MPETTQPLGVTVHDPDRAYQGYTLFCESYEDPTLAEDGRGKIYLIDMEGEIVHTWHTWTAQQSFARLLPDGNLIYPTRDRSDISQADFQVMSNGHMILNCVRDHMWRELDVMLKRCPYMVEVGRDWELLWEWHGEHHLQELEELLSPESWDHFRNRVAGQFSFDWAHNNTLQIIPPNATYEAEVESGDEPRFTPGNIMFSYRSVDIIGVIDRDTSEIVWAWGPGVLDGQHKPHMLPNGNILIFDNGTLRGWSRVIEVNPLNNEIEWEYTADPKEDFFAGYISGAQRLPTIGDADAGNTLICEGSKAHLFEVTSDGEVVWDFRYPWHVEGGLGSIYRCFRYPPEYVQPLLERIGKA